MANQRKKPPIDVTRLVLHECGYKCGNPACRGIITLDIHHLEYVSDGGGNGAENLLPLCPNCHALHHAGHIPTASLRAWKVLLLSLNEGFDRTSVNTLLALDKLGDLRVTTDGLLLVSGLIASDLPLVKEQWDQDTPQPPVAVEEGVEYLELRMYDGKLD